MKKHIVILSLFDGMSCGQLALRKVYGKDYLYYASEIEDSSIKVTMTHFPNTIQLGDIRDIKLIEKKVDLLIGGSPCKSLSFMGKRKGMITKENIEIITLDQYLDLKKNKFEFKGESYLFWEYIRIMKEINPKYFLLENVKMSKKWEDIISRELEVEPIRINSSLVSPQNRDRLYWTDIPNVSIPEDKGIILSDVIPGALSCGYRGRMDKNTKKYIPTMTVRKDGKANCVVTSGSINKIILPNNEERDLTINELEMLQTVPIGYTDIQGITKTSKRKMMGNGWTIDVISHIFENIPEIKLKS